MPIRPNYQSGSLPVISSWSDGCTRTVYILWLGLLLLFIWKFGLTHSTHAIKRRSDQRSNIGWKVSSAVSYQQIAHTKYITDGCSIYEKTWKCSSRILQTESRKTLRPWHFTNFTIADGCIPFSSFGIWLLILCWLPVMWVWIKHTHC